MGIRQTPVQDESFARWPVLSLFSGAGGFDLGFRMAGFQPELAIDVEPAAVATYTKNHPFTRVVQLDLAVADPATIASLWTAHVGTVAPVGIIGGPPCQAFSVSNVHQRINDPRRTLLNNYASTIEAFVGGLGLDFFVFENVPGLVNKKHGAYFQQFRERCEAAGFKVSLEVVDAGRFGIPQRRKRLIVAGVNAQRFPGISIELPTGNGQPLPVREVLEGLPEPAFCTRGRKEEEVLFHPNHITMVPRSPKFTNGSLQPGDRRGRSFRVLAWDSPSYTVAYGHREVHVHPDCHRRLSVYEAMLLQGLPNSYQLKGTFSQQVQLVSDVVPPPLAMGIATTIRKTLGYNKHAVTTNKFTGEES